MLVHLCSASCDMASQCGSQCCRKHGLFGVGDPLLRQLASEAHTHAFEKHLAGEFSPYELLDRGSWTSGDEAAQAGFDLRLFYKASLHTASHPYIVCAGTIT